MSASRRAVSCRSASRACAISDANCSRRARSVTGTGASPGLASDWRSSPLSAVGVNVGRTGLAGRLPGVRAFLSPPGRAEPSDFASRFCVPAFCPSSRLASGVRARPEAVPVPEPAADPGMPGSVGRGGGAGEGAAGPSTVGMRGGGVRLVPGAEAALAASNHRCKTIFVMALPAWPEPRQAALPARA